MDNLILSAALLIVSVAGLLGMRVARRIGFREGIQSARRSPLIRAGLADIKPSRNARRRGEIRAGRPRRF